MKPINLRHEKRKGHWYGIFLCQCGKEHVARVSHIKFGAIKSCGCLTGTKTVRHRMTNTPTYKTWEKIKQRCFNPKNKAFQRYGAKGIIMADAWANSFELFFAEMGERPPGMTIDRIDNSKGYEPGNCRWATWEEQQNNRTNNRKFEMDGKSQTVDRWARELGIHRDKIWHQIKSGKSIREAIESVRNQTKKG